MFKKLKLLCYIYLDEKRAFSITLANRSAALYHIGEYRLAPVSYTHLDVYKRQTYTVKQHCLVT